MITGQRSTCGHPSYGNAGMTLDPEQTEKCIQDRGGTMYLARAKIRVTSSRDADPI